MKVSFPYGKESLSLDIPEAWIEEILGNNMQKILDKTILPA